MCPAIAGRRAHARHAFALARRPPESSRLFQLASTPARRLSGLLGRAAGRVTVLVFSGNAGNRAHRGPLAAALYRRGLQVLLVDYRGYGRNPGAPTEHGLVTDSRAAGAYLAGRPDVDASRIVYFGESLGTAVAVDLAVEHPPAALVLRSPFTSMADVGQHHYPFLPVRLLLRDTVRGD